MSATVQDPLVGRVLDGRYLVQSRIARGGMATVYLAVDDRLDREIALKVMHPHLADDDEFVARFVREARSAARLSHPNVVQVFDQGADGDVLYLAMEHLPGRTLRDVLDERGALTVREALTVLEPVLDALSAAHRSGIMHRDIKPENVILTDEGRVKVADFGLARAATGGPTQTGSLMGTVAYLSPELVTRGIADARSDVYAAGIMFFELLTGRQPFLGDVPMQVAYRHVHEDVPPPSTLVPGLPTEVDQLVLVATARDPDDRPTDAGHWLRLIRTGRAQLTDQVLDAAPDVAGLRAAGVLTDSATEHPGSPTEVMIDAGQQNATEALPELTALQRLRERSRREAKQLDDETPRPRPDRGFLTSPHDAELTDLVRRRRRRGIIATVVVVLLTAALGVGAWWFAEGPGAFTTAPALTRLPQSQVTQVLAAEGLNGQAQPPEYSETAPKGQVSRSEPDAGAKVRKGATVRYWLSLGTARRSVPAVAGLTQSAATAALGTTDLVPGPTVTRYHPQIAKGQVIESQPAVGGSVTAGSVVVLVVSKGPEPVTVPTLAGRTSAEATRSLESLGLRASITEEFSGDVAAGVVIRQAPASGTLLPGQSVALTVSKGPELVTVPDVFGKQYAQAKQELEQLGFTVVKKTFLNGAFGTVRQQSPSAGQRVPPRTAVSLLVV